MRSHLDKDVCQLMMFIPDALKCITVRQVIGERRLRSRGEYVRHDVHAAADL